MDEPAGERSDMPLLDDISHHAAPRTREDVGLPETSDKSDTTEAGESLSTVPDTDGDGGTPAAPCVPEEPHHSERACQDRCRFGFKCRRDSHCSGGCHLHAPLCGRQYAHVERKRLDAWLRQAQHLLDDDARSLVRDINKLGKATGDGRVRGLLNRNRLLRDVRAALSMRSARDVPEEMARIRAEVDLLCRPCASADPSSEDDHAAGAMLFADGGAYRMMPEEVSMWQPTMLVIAVPPGCVLSPAHGCCSGALMM